MKRFTICILAVIVTAAGSLAIADIQAPPGARYGVFRKLSRGLSNIFYGASEIPYSWNKTRRSEGSSAAFSYGVLHGTERTIVRLGYGLYEVVTFPFPSYKKSYKPPAKSQYRMADMGYTEFPPSLGFSSETDFVIPGNPEVIY